MSDGPFKNLKLDSRWKRFARAVENRASGEDERKALACHALVYEILSNGTSALLTDLKALASHPQLELVPGPAIQYLFNKNKRTPVLSGLEKQLMAKIAGNMPLAEALPQAVHSFISERVGEVENRMEERCIAARESGEIRQPQSERILSQMKTTFSKLPVNQIYEEVMKCNKKAFKSAASKKKDLDEGPNL